LNDTIQSLLPAIYPILKSSYQLSFAQVGLMTLTLQLTASLLQPIVGIYTDRHHTPYSLVVGMGFSLVGLLLLSVAGRLGSLLLAAGLVGVGSSVFHPESSRVAGWHRAGARHGAVGLSGRRQRRLRHGPAARGLLVLPRGQISVAWCSLVALLAMIVLYKVGGWYRSTVRHRRSARAHRPRRREAGNPGLSKTGSCCPLRCSSR
jgi:FSR family fosmidomycin resistance protein-like MFS transporter